MKQFLFKPEQAEALVSTLSGGEKNRLMLALTLAKESNFLVMDEPTNDLDMDTLDLLQDVLSEYEGTILIISHDRDFMDKVATSLLYMKGNGTIIEHIGTYTSLLQKIKSDLKSHPVSSSKPTPKTIIKEKTKTFTKLSYKDQRLFEVLPSEIQEIEKKICEIENELSSDTDLYSRDPKKFDLLTTELQNLKLQKSAKEDIWLEISLKVDDLN